jgi:uncharacterized cupin superfamily protein
VQHHFQSPNKPFNLRIWQSGSGSGNIHYREYEYGDNLKESSIIIHSQDQSVAANAGDKRVISAGLTDTWSMVNGQWSITV